MIARISGAGHQLSKYTISDREMAVGSTLGGPKATLLIKATGALRKVYSPQAGTDAFGALVLHHWNPGSGIPLVAAPGDFTIHPYRQEHLFELSNGVTVHEDIFILSSAPRDGRHQVDPPGAYYAVRLRNESGETIEMATYASLRLKGGLNSTGRTSYDARRHAFVVRNDERPDFVRIAGCSVRPASYEVTLDTAKTSAAQFPGELSNTVLDEADDPIGIFHLAHRIRPGDQAEFYFLLSFSLEGEAAALKAFAALPDADEARESTHAYYEVMLNRAVVMTPDPEVNRGVLWAKANMLRTQTLTTQGWCFVNDPTRSNNSVARDTCWYAFGADYVNPEFARESLMWYARHLEPNGMVVEYFDIRS
ncbi:MAG TPA: hypothetical protein VFE17_00625, partial [Candidatus Baltobacteraceae bacterium]|nr:hypothetical protein [Candidatus Baltobacteraceae bacterium]